MEQELMRQFITASLRFRKVDFCELSQDDIHIGELVVMSSIYEAGQCAGNRLNVQQIQSILHVSKPAVSQILGSLERKGCIVRHIDPDDRRKIAVYPTEKGNELLKESGQNYDRTFCEIIDRLGADNMKLLVELIDQLGEIVDEIKKENLEETV